MVIVPLDECNRMGLEVFVLRVLIGLKVGWWGRVPLRQGCCGVSMPVNDMFVVWQTLTSRMILLNVYNLPESLEKCNRIRSTFL